MNWLRALFLVFVAACLTACGGGGDAGPTQEELAQQNASSYADATVKDFKLLQSDLDVLVQRIVASGSDPAIESAVTAGLNGFNQEFSLAVYAKQFLKEAHLQSPVQAQVFAVCLQGAYANMNKDKVGMTANFDYWLIPTSVRPMFASLWNIRVWQVCGQKTTPAMAFVLGGGDFLERILQNYKALNAMKTDGVTSEGDAVSAWSELEQRTFR